MWIKHNPLFKGCGTFRKAVGPHENGAISALFKKKLINILPGV